MKTPNLRNLPVSPLRWNKVRQQYILPNGRFVSQGTVRDIVDADIEATAARVAKIGQTLQKVGLRYQAGIIDQATFTNAVENWRTLMREQVKGLHLANAAAASGGFHNMGPKDWGRAGQRIQYNYGKLDGFVADILATPELLTGNVDGKMPFQMRVGLYAANGRASYEAISWANHLDMNYGYAENVLESGAHHCEGDDSCPAQTAKGRVLIRDYLLPFHRICGPACLCKSRYFMTAS